MFKWFQKKQQKRKIKIINKNNDLQLSNEQAETITLSSDIYHDSTPSQQHSSFSSTEKLIKNENVDHLTKKNLTSKIKKLIF